MRHRVYILIPGILQHPEGVDDWCDVARDLILTQTDHVAVTYEYRTGIIRTKENRRRWAADLAELCRRFAGLEIVPVGHSNGCAIILDCLKDHPDVSFHSVHLFAPAAFADYDKNGLNETADRIAGELWIYGSPTDRALWAGNLAWVLFGWLGRGYGDLGRVGPKNQRGRAAAITYTDFREYDHCTWVDEELPASIQLVLGGK